ncbi:rap1 GTPase-GDP dissociation stimulator 1-like isoform X3 [Portunus trituberculatus]|uniref:rap1 GTPase-GDP dissociation stimulator 1-like isoform X3 n=1 Tax=Portunus trituberculatus TaxID=210409 RepID=UPI001E1CDE1A|nr:rap1 GTPase-GDP dissociation stimulator 1-like isoform X3 [Portunus trituberculatus]
MDDLATNLEKLRVASEETNCEPFEKLINQLHNLGPEDGGDVCEELVNGGVLPLALGAIQGSNEDMQAKGAELVAELAKVENCRLGCVTGGLVPILVEKMSSPSTKVALQACRALGNICYEHVSLSDGGRVSVMESGGAGQLLGLLQRAAQLSDSPEDHQLRLVATGFLLNLLNSYETMQDQSMEAELVEVLCHYLDKFAEDEDIPTHVLLSLTCMADTEVGKGLVVSKDVTPQLVRVLRINESPEVIETCLELITNIAETECVKTQVAKGGVCEAVVDVVRRHRDTPSSDLFPPIIKTATDLIVYILVGDDSMGIVYGGGSGPVYQELVEWLTSELEDLQIAGALAMGNFARSDAHCIQMVQSGIAEKLLKVLSSHNTGEGDIRLQHALLSALRNLSIAKENKPALISQRALEVLLPMVATVETFPVVFKLLATLRMIIDGQTQAALKVGGDEAVVGRLVGWCSTTDHPGVQGEASRLLAWIIKNCEGNAGVVTSLVTAGCIAPLVLMLGSEHAVMVSEAALALTLAFSTEPGREAAGSTKLKEVAPFVLKNPYLPPEILCNVLSMLVALLPLESAVDAIKSDDLQGAVTALTNHANEEVKKLSGVLKEKL